MTGKIHSTTSYSTVDGPGIRYIVFLQGCNLRCKFCHNPDTWNMDGESISSEDLICKILKYKDYLTGGGVTISGGEPLLQIDFVIHLFEKLKEQGINTCLDTSGNLFDKSNSELLDKYKKLVDVCDLVLLDIKHIEEVVHRNLTGKTNKNILEFLEFLSEHKKDVWIRYVLIPSINDDMEVLQKTRNTLEKFDNISKIEILPYHGFAIEKYEKLGLKYEFENILPPTKESIRQANKILNFIKNSL